MLKRNSIHKKNKQTKVKVFAGVVLLTFGIGSSVNAVFADQDIESLLTNWFDEQKSESISQIDAAIMDEKEVLKERLREELQTEMDEAEKELHQFTENKKQEKIKALRQHASKIISEMEIDHLDEEERINTEIASIVEEAVSKINLVKDESSPLPISQTEKDKEVSTSQGDNSTSTEGEKDSNENKSLSEEETTIVEGDGNNE
jgi:maltooligosyltrehalose synthase